MKKSIIGLSLIVLCIIIIIVCFYSVSCLPWMRGQPYPDCNILVNYLLKWENIPVENKHTKGFDNTQTIQILDDFYNSLGNRITFDSHFDSHFGSQTGLTPEKFRLGVKGIPTTMENTGGDLRSLDKIDTDNPENLHIDFLLPDSNIIHTRCNGYNYEVGLDFATVNMTYSRYNQFDPPLLFKPGIEVEIPGYTFVDFPDVYASGFETPEDNPIDGTVLYERRWITGNTFHFTPGFLMPNYTVVDEAVTPYRPYMEIDVDSMDYEIFEGRVLPVEWFVFNDSIDEIKGAFPGYPGEGLNIYVTHYCHVYELDSSTSFSLLQYPFEGLFIDGIYYEDHNCERVVITIGMDMEEIIEVYDYNTPEDKSDDVVVLAYGWWNRFSFDVSYE